MADSNSLALLVRPPEIDMAGTLMAASQIQNAQANSSLAQMKLRQANRQEGALDAYRLSGNLQDLKGEPDIYSKYSEMADADTQRKLIANARDAQSLIAMPQEQRAQAWPSLLEKARREGRIDDGTHQRLMQIGPSDLVLHNVIQMASKIPSRLEDAHAKLYEAQADAAKNPAGPFKTSKDQLEYEQGLRREYTSLPAVKDYGTVRDAYGKIQGAANGSAAGDISLIFAYMKMLDPSSTVREGEFATAQNAAGVPDRIRNMYDQVMTGTRLNPEQRKDFIDHARRIYGVHEKQYSAVRGQFSNLAKKVGLDPTNVTLDFGAFDEAGGDPYGRGPERPQTVARPPETERFTAPPRSSGPQNLPPRAQVDGGGTGQIPPNAVRYLQGNPSPEVIQQFEQKYGAGSARQFLQQR